MSINTLEYSVPELGQYSQYYFFTEF